METESNINICPLRLILENSNDTGVFRLIEIKDIQNNKRSFSFPIPIPTDLALELGDLNNHTFTYFGFSDIDKNSYIEKLVNIFYLIGSLYENKLIIPKVRNIINRQDFNSYNEILSVYFQLLKSPHMSKYIEQNNESDSTHLISYYCLSMLPNEQNNMASIVVKSYIKFLEEVVLFSDKLSLRDNIANINKDFFIDNHFNFKDLSNFLYDIERYYLNFISKKTDEVSLNNYIIEEITLLDINKLSFIQSFEPVIAADLLAFISILEEFKKSIFNTAEFLFEDGSIDGQLSDDNYLNEIVNDIISEKTFSKNLTQVSTPNLRSIKQQCLYPLPYEEHILLEEKYYLKEALSDIYNDKEVEKYINRFFKNKEIHRNYKKILNDNRYPSEQATYRNESYLHILSYLKPLTVDCSLLDKVKELKINYPHFYEIIDYLEICLKMNIRKNGVLNFKPILILGKNGIGKSAFIDEINNIFNIYMNAVNIGNMTTPSEIAGSTSLWNTGQPGFVSKTVIRNKCYNPIIVLEEMDKVVTGNANGRIMAPLYDLLEQRSAEDFYENFFSVSFDFSYVNYIATANSLENIDKGIINRFRVFTIKSPREEELPAIIKSIYSQLKKDSIFDLVEINEIGLKSIANAFAHEKILNVRKIYKFMEDLLMDASQFNESNDVYIIDYLDDGYISHSTTLH